LTSDKQHTSSSQLLASLSDITNRISESLKKNANAEVLDSLANEHRYVMEQLKRNPTPALNKKKSMLMNVYGQVQSVQKEMNIQHQAIKEKLISFSKKRKQLNAYNAL